MSGRTLSGFSVSDLAYRIHLRSDMTLRTIGLKSIMLSMALVLGGCSYLRIQQGLRMSADDWTMYGGSIGRTNVAGNLVKPPFTRSWEYDASAGFSPYSAAIADSFLFVGNLQGEVHVIHAATGKGAGSYDFGSAIVGTPVIDGSTMYVALSHDGATLISFDLTTGKIDWQSNVGDIETSPLLIGKRIFVTSQQGKLVCVGKSNGEIVWTYNVPPNKRTRLIHSSPASDGKVVVFGCDNGDLYGVGIDDGKLRWSAHTGGSILASPSVAAGKVFIGSLDESFYAFDIETGKPIWSRPLGAKIFSSQAVSTNSVYVGTAGRNVFCLDAGTGSVVWQATTGNIVNATPLIANDIVYVGCLDKTLYAYAAQTGELVWKYVAEGRIKTMPLAWRQYLFLLAEDRSVIAFKQGSPP